MKFKLFIYLISLGGFLAIIFINATNTTGHLWKDEHWYLYDVALLHQYGFTKEFLLKYWGPAGPLYAVVHALFEPVTQLKANRLRLMNTFFLGLIILIISQIIIKKEGVKDLWVKSLSILSIPTIYVIGGMALTEMPAMLFLSIALFLFTESLSNNSQTIKITQSIAGGLCLSFAILGRQPYLLVIPCSLLFLIPIKNFRQNYLPVCLFIISSLLLPLYVFNIWGNIQSAKTIDTAKGINSFYGILGLGYGAIFTLLIAPAWFYIPSKKHLKYYLLGAAAIIISNVFLFQYSFLPMYTIIESTFTVNAAVTIAKIFASLIIILAAYFVISGLMRFFQKPFMPDASFYIACCFLIIATCFKVVHQFSSRYVAQAAPFMILMLAPYIKANSYKFLATIAGVVLGILSLLSFIHSA